MAVVGMRTATLVVAFVTIFGRRSACAPAPTRLHMTPFTSVNMMETDSPFAEVITDRVMLRDGTEEMIDWADFELQSLDELKNNDHFDEFEVAENYEAQMWPDEENGTLDESAEVLDQIFTSTCELNDDSCETLFGLGFPASPEVLEPVLSVAEDDWLQDLVAHKHEQAIPMMPEPVVTVAENNWEADAFNHLRDEIEAPEYMNMMPPPEPEIRWKPTTDRPERMTVEPERLSRGPDSYVQRKPATDRWDEMDRVVNMMLSREFRPISPDPMDVMRTSEPEIQVRPLIKQPEELTLIPDSYIPGSLETGSKKHMDAVVQMLLSNRNMVQVPRERSEAERAADLKTRPKLEDTRYILMDSVVHMLMNRKRASPNPELLTDTLRDPDSKVQWKSATDRQEQVTQEPENVEHSVMDHQFGYAVHDLLHKRAMQAAGGKVIVNSA